MRAPAKGSEGQRTAATPPPSVPPVAAQPFSRGAWGRLGRFPGSQTPPRGNCYILSGSFLRINPQRCHAELRNNAALTSRWTSRKGDNFSSHGESAGRRERCPAQRRSGTAALGGPGHSRPSRFGALSRNSLRSLSPQGDCWKLLYLQKKKSNLLLPFCVCFWHSLYFFHLQKRHLNNKQ